MAKKRPQKPQARKKNKPKQQQALHKKQKNKAKTKKKATPAEGNFYTRFCDRIFGFFEKKPLYGVLTSLAIATLFVVIFVSNITPVYRISDNAGILLNIRNGFDISYMSIILGRFFTFLYLNVSETIAWYGYFIYFSLTVATAGITYALMRIRSLRYFFLPALFLIYAFIATFLVETGYNPGSIMSGTAGLLLFFSYISTSRKKRWWVVLLIGLVFGLSFMVRIKGIVAASIFAFPLIVLYVLQNIRENLKYLLIFAFPAVFFFSTDFLIKQYDVPQQYTDFELFNDERGPFHGYPLAEKNRDNQTILDKNNWTTIDYSILENWVFYNEEKFNIETLQNVHKYSVPIEKARLNATTLRKAFDYLHQYYTMYWWLFAFTFLYSLVYFDYRRTLLVLLYLLYALAGAVLMEVFLRFPPRIGLSLFLEVALLALLLSNFSLKKIVPAPEIKSKTMAGFAYLILNILLLVTVSKKNDQTKLLIKNAELDNQLFEQNFKFLNSYFKDRVVIIQPGIKIYLKTDQNPLKVYQYNFTMIPTGWMIYSPRFYDIINELGMEKATEVYPFMIDNDDAFFVFSQEMMTLILSHIRDTHNIHCKVYIQTEVAGDMGIYQLKTDKNIPENPEEFRVFYAENPQEILNNN